MNIRYCVSCEEIKEFIYNKVIHHGECKECGARFAIKNNRSRIHLLIQKKYNKMTEIADKWFSHQMDLFKQVT